MRIMGWLMLLSLIGTEGAIAQTQVIRRAREVVDQAETATTERLESVSTDEVESSSGSSTASEAAAPAQTPNLPSVVVPATPGSQRVIEFNAPSTPVADTSQPSPEALARWHIRNNLCERSEWSLQDFQSLFPMIDPGLVRQVCGS